MECKNRKKGYREREKVERIIILEKGKEINNENKEKKVDMEIRIEDWGRVVEKKIVLERGRKGKYSIEGRRIEKKRRIKGIEGKIEKRKKVLEVD